MASRYPTSGHLAPQSGRRTGVPAQLLRILLKCKASFIAFQALSSAEGSLPVVAVRSRRVTRASLSHQPSHTAKYIQVHEQRVLAEQDRRRAASVLALVTSGLLQSLKLQGRPSRVCTGVKRVPLAQLGIASGQAPPIGPGGLLHGVLRPGDHLPAAPATACHRLHCTPPACPAEQFMKGASTQPQAHEVLCPPADCRSCIN